MFPYQTSSNVRSIQLSAAGGAAEGAAMGAINLNEVCDGSYEFFFCISLIRLPAAEGQAAYPCLCIKLGRVERGLALPNQQNCLGYYHAHSSSSSFPLHFDR